MQSDMGVLDDFEFSLPDEDFKALYFVMGQPRKIDAAIEHVGTLGEELREKYAHDTSYASPLTLTLTLTNP